MQRAARISKSNLVLKNQVISKKSLKLRWLFEREEAAESIVEIMDFIAAHIEELTAELRKHLKLDQNFNTTAQHFTAQALLAPILGFIHAVDWTEPWIICLLVFHFFLLVVVVTSRKHTNVQMGIFLFGVVGVYCAEYLNTLLSHNWTRFSRQQYFDPFGIFLSTLWSGPLLLITTVVLVNSLFTLTGLLVKWKRAELRYRSRLAQQKSQ